jgi:hypothetical protein
VKKISLIFSLTIITVLSVGSAFIHYCLIKSHKANLKSFNSLQAKTNEIIIDSANLYKNTAITIWQDDNKEIYVNDDLYDVISIRYKNGKAILTVLIDAKEKSLNQLFASNFGNSSNKNSNNPIKLLKHFFSLKFIVDKEELLKATETQFVSRNNTAYYLKLAEGFLTIEPLPPNFS